MERSKSMGAGVVPFFRDAMGEPHFVFAQERCDHSWRASGKLSAFGGGAHADETAARTAARELREESLSSFPLDNLETELSNGNFALRVINTYATVHGLRYHTTFVKAVPPSPAWMVHFDATRRVQMQAQCALRRWHLLHDELLDHHADDIAASHLPMPKLGDACVHVRVASPSLLCVRTSKCHNDVTVDVGHLSAQCVQAYVRWCGIGARLHEHRAHLHEACPRMMGADFVLDDAYLEISGMHVWSYTELCSLETTQTTRHVFRREFIAVLRVMLREFAPSSHIKN